MYDILELNSRYLIELRDIARSMGIERVEIMKKSELVFKIINLQPVRIATPPQFKNTCAAVRKKPELFASKPTKYTFFHVFFSYFSYFSDKLQYFSLSSSKNKNG